MRSHPKVGDRVTHRVAVTAQMTARLFGREVHPVYATAWMVRHVEEAGRLLVEGHLREGEDATGYRLELTHERPAAVGDELTIIAEVTRVDDRECVAAFQVLGREDVVGRGSFVQRYVTRGRLGERT